MWNISFLPTDVYVGIVQGLQRLFVEIRSYPVGISDFHEWRDTVDSFRDVQVGDFARLRFMHVGQQSNIVFLENENKTRKLYINNF